MGFTLIDYLALGFFFGSSLLHFWVINHSRWAGRTLTHEMNRYRLDWMLNMIRRETKMVDALIQNSLQQGVLFFASTSILLVGALLAGLGASDKAVTVLNELPFTVVTTREQWELKVLFVTMIFVFAFFKFAWANRLFNYVIILIGAAPDRTTGVPEADPAELERYAGKLSRLHGLGAMHFTTGVNAYFHALSAIAWFIDPELFLVSVLWVQLVLYRRAFHSNFARILTE